MAFHRPDYRGVADDAQSFRYYHHHHQTRGARGSTTTGGSTSDTNTNKRWCYTGLATVLWVTLLLQFFAVVATLIRQNVTCGWNPLRQRHADFCFPLQHPVVEGLVLALYLGVLWAAMFVSWMLVAWAVRAGLRKHQRWSEERAAATTTSASSRHGATMDAYNHHYPVQVVTVPHFYHYDSFASSSSHDWNHHHGSSQSSPPTVASSCDESDKEESDELSPLIVHVV